MFCPYPPRWVQLPHRSMPLHLDLSRSPQQVVHFSKPHPKQGSHTVPKACRVKKGMGHSMTPDRIRNTACKGNLAQFRLMNTVPQTSALHSWYTGTHITGGLQGDPKHQDIAAMGHLG